MSSSWDKNHIQSLLTPPPGQRTEGAGGSHHKGALCSVPFSLWTSSWDDFTLLLSTHKYDRTGVARLLTAIPAVHLRHRPGEICCSSSQAAERAFRLRDGGLPRRILPLCCQKMVGKCWPANKDGPSAAGCSSSSASPLAGAQRPCSVASQQN